MSVLITDHLDLEAVAKLPLQVLGCIAMRPYPILDYAYACPDEIGLLYVLGGDQYAPLALLCYLFN